MQIQVNGTATELPDSATVADLLDRLSLRRDGVAVAVNMRVIPRSQHEQTPLQPGDTVEVIQAVGGG